MTLLKAYLLKTDDPIKMLNIYYDEVCSLIKAEADETFMELLDEIPSYLTETIDPATKEQFDLMEVKNAIDKLKKDKNLEGLFYEPRYEDVTRPHRDFPHGNLKEVVGEKFAGWGNKPRKAKAGPTKIGTKSPYSGWIGEQTTSAKGSAMQSNLFRMVDVLGDVADKSPEIRLIIRALQKAAEEIPPQGENKDITSDKKKDDEVLKYYKKVRLQLKRISKLEKQLQSGEQAEDGTIIYGADITNALEQLLAEPEIFHKLEDFIDDEGEIRTPLSQQYDGTKHEEAANKIELEIKKLLQSNVVMINNENEKITLPLLTLEGGALRKLSANLNFGIEPISRTQSQRYIRGMERLRSQLTEQAQTRLNKVMGKISAKGKSKKQRFADDVEIMQLFYDSLKNLYMNEGMKPNSKKIIRSINNMEKAFDQYLKKIDTKLRNETDKIAEGFKAIELRNLNRDKPNRAKYIQIGKTLGDETKKKLSEEKRKEALKVMVESKYANNMLEHLEQGGTISLGGL